MRPLAECAAQELAQFAKCYPADAVITQRSLGLWRQQRLHLDLTLLLEARAGSRQVGIAYPGMEHDFRAAMRKCVDQFTQSRRVEASSGREPKKMFWVVEIVFP